MTSELEILKKYLSWALDEIDKRSELDEEGTPKHPCGFDLYPNEAYCEFHDKYWGARSALVSEEAALNPD